MSCRSVVHDGHGSCSNHRACRAVAIDIDQVITGLASIIQELETMRPAPCKQSLKQAND